MDERHVKTDINLRESKVSVTAVPFATLERRELKPKCGHLPIFFLALLTVPESYLQFRPSI